MWQKENSEVFECMKQLYFKTICKFIQTKYNYLVDKELINKPASPALVDISWLLMFLLCDFNERFVIFRWFNCCWYCGCCDFFWYWLFVFDFLFCDISIRKKYKVKTRYIYYKMNSCYSSLNMFKSKRTNIKLSQRKKRSN